MPRAYDLIGDVNAPAEIFRRLDALASMVGNLRERGLHDAADETAEIGAMSTVHEDWPARPAWADEDGGTGFANTSKHAVDPDDQAERHFLLEVTVGASTARVEEFHVRQEGEEGAGLIDKVGPFVSFSPDDLTPEMAGDTLTALTQLLERYNARA